MRLTTLLRRLLGITQMYVKQVEMAAGGLLAVSVETQGFGQNAGRGVANGVVINGTSGCEPLRSGPASSPATTPTRATSCGARRRSPSRAT